MSSRFNCMGLNKGVYCKNYGLVLKAQSFAEKLRKLGLNGTTIKHLRHNVSNNVVTRRGP